MSPEPPASLTVAIPTYRGARHVGAALRSILDQGGVRFNLLVVDDRSGDDTLDRVREAAGDRARIAVNPERLGLAGNWDRCVALATTPLVAIFHQDDLMRPGHLAAHVAAFASGRASGAEPGLVASNAGVVDADGRALGPRIVDPGGLGPADRTYLPGEALADLADHNPLRCSAVTIRSEAHAAVGGFDPSYRYVVDWDFWLRVAARYRVQWLGATSVDVRWHASSETHTFRSTLDDLDETTRLLDVLAARHPLLLEQRPHADRRLARAYLNRAYEAAKAGRPGLGRRALSRAWRLDRGTIRKILFDPRLMARLTLGLGPWSRDRNW